MSLVLYTLFLVLLVTKILINFLTKQRKKCPPSPFPRIPIVGHMFCMAPYHENPWEGFCALKQKLGDIYFLQMGIRKIVVISSFDVMKEVLLTKGEIFVNRPDFNRYHVIFGGDRENALALCDWSRTQRMRRLVAQMVVIPRFGSQLFQQLNGVIESHNREFLTLKKEAFSRNSSVLLTKSDVLFWCANIFSQYLCSKRFDFGDPGYAKAISNYDYIFGDINQSYAWDFMPWLTTYFGAGSTYLKTLSDACIDVRKYVGESVIHPRLQRYMEEHGLDEEAVSTSKKDKITQASKSDSISPDTETADLNEEDLLKSRGERDMTGKDFLDVSLEYHFQFKDTYPWEVAVFEVLDLIGGHSAVGNLLMRALGHLALDSQAQEIIYREGQRALQNPTITCEDDDDDNDDITSKRLINLTHRTLMPFTEACIMETLRLASSPIIPHVASRDTTLSGYHVEKGTMVLFNTYHLNMSDQYWKDATSFNPKRFLVCDRKSAEVRKGSVNNNDSSTDESDCDISGVREEDWKILKPEHFVPFSFGRRACLGYKLVNSCCFSAIANLCQEFILSPESVELTKMMREQLAPNGNLALPVDNDGKCFQIKLVPRRSRDITIM